MEGRRRPRPGRHGPGRLSATGVALGLALTGLLAAGVSGAAAAGRVVPLGPDDRAAFALLGPGVVGEPVPAAVLDPERFVHLRPGRWTYRFVSGSRRGEREVEHLAPSAQSGPRADWTRTVGREYVLHVRGDADGSLVMPREAVRSQGVVVHFDPPLTYLIAGLGPGERRSAESRMTVYSAENPTLRRYSGRITSTTTYVGAHRVRTPAGSFDAALIRTDYAIEVFGLVSVWDVLHTLYAPGVGKVAEVERRRVSALGLPMSGLETAKVLVDRWIEPDTVEASTVPGPPPGATWEQAPRRRRVRRRA